MKNPTENNEASHNYVKGANVGGFHTENFRKSEPTKEEPAGMSDS